jgi:hypothetical protein
MPDRGRAGGAFRQPEIKPDGRREEAGPTPLQLTGCNEISPNITENMQVRFFLALFL